MKILIIQGSIRLNNVGEDLCKRIRDRVRKEDECELFVPSGSMSTVVKPYHNYGENEEIPDYMQDFHKKIRHADLILFVVPEYNHAPAPAILAVVDNFYKETWGGKEVAVLSYGAQNIVDGKTYANAVMHDVLAEVGANLLRSTHFQTIYSALEHPDLDNQIDAVLY